MANVTRIKASDPGKEESEKLEKPEGAKVTRVVAADKTAKAAEAKEKKSPAEAKESSEEASAQLEMAEDSGRAETKKPSTVKGVTTRSATLPAKETEDSKKVAEKTDSDKRSTEKTDDGKKLANGKELTEKTTKKTAKTHGKEKKPFILIRPFVALGHYLRDSWREIRQVRWPNRKATWKMVLAVLVYTAMFVILISLLDMFFTWLFSMILGSN